MIDLLIKGLGLSWETGTGGLWWPELTDSVEAGGDTTSPTSRSVPIPPLEWESASNVTICAAEPQSKRLELH